MNFLNFMKYFFRYYSLPYLGPKILFLLFTVLFVPKKCFILNCSNFFSSLVCVVEVNKETIILTY